MVKIKQQSKGGDMKKYLFFLIVYMMPMVANAYCWQIKNNDRRNFCLAISKNEANYCWQIRDNGWEKYCLALVEKEKSYCWQTGDDDITYECLALVEAKR